MDSKASDYSRGADDLINATHVELETHKLRCFRAAAAWACPKRDRSENRRRSGECESADGAKSTRTRSRCSYAGATQSQSAESNIGEVIAKQINEEFSAAQPALLTQREQNHYDL